MFRQQMSCFLRPFTLEVHPMSASHWRSQSSDSPASAAESCPKSASPNPPAPPRRRRGRARTQRGLVRPRCPVHGGEMLVGRTVGCVQYRYCTVEGCPSAVTTFRSDAPHKRWPPASHEAVAVRERAPVANEGTDRPGGSAVGNPHGVTVIPQEPPATPAEWPLGRPAPGQSS